LKAKERDIFNFFAKENIGRIVDIKIVRDGRNKISKGVCYVEFESQESVLLACALSGQPITGKFLKYYSLGNIRFSSNT
jgi:RNA recognition motif-containing protein